MPDYFDQPLAYNPDTEQLLAGASFQVYAADDLSYSTPLAVFEAASGVALSALVSSGVGVLPQFRVQGDPQEIILRSGSFTTRLTSKYGTRGEPGKSAFEAASEAGYNGSEEEFAHSLSLIGRTIESAVIDNGNGHLMLTTTAGEVLDAGVARGATGVGIASMSASGGNLLVTLSNGNVVDLGALPAGPPVSPTGSTAGQVYTSAGPSSPPSWQTPSAGIAGAPSSWPTSFPPAAHTTDLSTLRSGASALAATVISLLAAADAAAARTAISAAAANHSHAASGLAFVPTGVVTATTVQDAIVQAAAMGGGGTSNTVTIASATAERKHPVTNVTLPAPPECVVLWVSATLPTHIATGDIWVTSAS